MRKNLYSDFSKEKLEDNSHYIGLLLEEKIMRLHFDIEIGRFSDESKCFLKQEIEFLFELLRVNNGHIIDAYIDNLFEKGNFLENRNYIGMKI